ncbi:hypothetical protein [uncultured Alteromonas sp.]|uniref:hypothetical protein n=1 Tax=uncultured Alteromonas sp. TaxID=179113 RepID=UPI0030EEEFDB|tara:strand:- start:670 stop:1104 length:435 start_codon:yes stop_codon:yes gene_type:complete
MKEIKLYRESNGQYSTIEAKRDDVSGAYVQKTDYDELRVEHYDERAKVQELLKENAELRYQIEKYESVLCGTCRGAGTVLISIDDGTDCPECVEHDNNIKADAVDRFIESVLKGGANYVKGQSYKPFVYLDDARNYANKLRGEQ